MEFGPIALEWIAYFLIAINFCAFAAFGIDKWLAEIGAYRISEASLLALALFGGAPGAYAGRHLFRHKTRKQPFSSQLHFNAALLPVAIAAFAVYRWLGG